jgi:TRAP-type C4-dicarboxylate transport system permease small subunit
MLVRYPADGRWVLSRALLICAYACCFFVLASFAMFAIDQANGASKHQVAALGGPVSTQTSTQPPGQPRRFIDGAASVLTSPFRALIHSSSQWAAEIGYTLLAVIVYGFGIGFLARWART